MTSQRLGKNINRYCGDTIEIGAVLRGIESAAKELGWRIETFFQTREYKLLALHRKSSRDLSPSSRIYISAGIHGDEPAGPLAALRLLQENQWPENADLWICPCLNPVGFTLNSRENADGFDLNRAYLNPSLAEVIAHSAWLERQPNFDLCLLLHEDWESHGFYLYEQNPEHRPSLAEPMIEAVAKVCPIDRNEVIEGRLAKDGIVRPNLDVLSRTDWPEAFYLISRKTRLCYTLEAPSDFALPVRVNALTAAVRTASELIAQRQGDR